MLRRCEYQIFHEMRFLRDFHESRVVCPVALVGQWASEIQKMAVGLKVVEHHGPSRSKGKLANGRLTPHAAHLERVRSGGLEARSCRGKHIALASLMSLTVGQITSYSVLASEHATYDNEASKGTDKTSKAKSKAKAKSKVKDSDDDDESDDDSFIVSDDSDAPGYKSIAKKKSAKKKPDALFRVNWWRIVLG